ncbi:GntP family permease [candidate division KSB1 bacterium]|nr:GntP family permease [candidate division KSB1 bacterium]
MTTLISLIIVLIIVVIASAKYKLHPFISLLLASIVIGFLSGLESTVIIESIEKGFGDTLKSIGLIIVFGAIIGQYLEKSGGTKKIAETLLGMIGEKKSPLVMNLTGFIVSIPVFCDSGFIILSSLNKAISKKTGISLAVLSVALATGLYATHVFVPPTPGPLAAAAALGADIGLVIVLGLVVAIPSALAGLFWAKSFAKKFKIVPDTDEPQNDDRVLPSTPLSFAPVMIPIILIACKSIANYPSTPFGEGIIYKVIDFTGDPFIALFSAVFISFFLKRKRSTSHNSWISDGLKNAGVIILITGAGGAFGNVLRTTDLGEYLGHTLSNWNAGLLLPFMIAALLKTSQGSSTVAIITTAAIVSPLLGPLEMDGETAKALTVLAIGAGAMTVSHINDSYFWVVSQFSNMDTPTALKTHTIATLLQGVFGMIIILLLSLILL